MRSDHAGYAVVALLLGLWSIQAWHWLSDPPFPVWDEQTHLGNGLDAYRVLAGGSLRELLLYADGPHYYPFVQYVLTAGLWHGTGIDARVARAVSLAATLLTVVALALLARRLAPRGQRDVAFVLATALWLAGPTLLRWQGAVMLDPLGACLTTWCLLAHLWWLARASSWWRGGLLATGLLFVFFTKYNFGGVLAVALVLHALLAGAGSRGLLRVAVWLLAPALLWLGHEPVKKLELLMAYPTHRTVERGLLEQIGFPLVSLVRDHAPHAAAGIVLLALLIVAAVRSERRTAGVLWLLFAVQAAAVAAISNQSGRFLLPAVPAACLAAALQAAALAGSRRRGRAAVLVLAVAIGSGSAAGGHELRAALAQRHRAELFRLRDWLAVQAARHGPLLLIGALNEVPAAMGPFEGVRVAGGDPTAPPLLLPPPPAYSYQPAGLLPLPRAAGEAELEAGLERHQARFGRASVPVVVIRLAPGASFRTDDYERYNAWQEPLAAAVARRAGAPSSAVTFADAELTVRLYAVTPVAAMREPGFAPR